MFIYHIYSNNNKICCVLNNVCGYECSASYESFIWVTSDDSTRTKNYVFQSSVANCEASTSYTMFHYYGNILYKSVNLSDNNANYYSAIDCRPNQKDENNIGISISYSSFSNNSAKTYYCIYLEYYSSSANQYEINMSNIIYKI